MAVTISGSTGVDIGAGNLTLPDDTTIATANGLGPTIVRSTPFSSPSSFRYSYSHGQGTVPDLVWVELKVLTAQHGYAVGASIKVSSMLELDETDYVMTMSGTSTTLNFAANNVNVVKYVGRNDTDTSAEAVFTAGNVELYLVGVWF